MNHLALWNLESWPSPILFGIWSFWSYWKSHLRFDLIDLIQDFGMFVSFWKDLIRNEIIDQYLEHSFQIFGMLYIEILFLE